MIDEKIVAFALGYPGLGPKRASYAWAELVVCKEGKPASPSAKQTSKLARRGPPRICAKQAGAWSDCSQKMATSSKASSRRPSPG
jgi:hypothetical protein